MDWQQPITDFAAVRGLAIVSAGVGVGIEFTDGCDVFWIIPGEVSSTIPVPADGPASVSDLMREFDRIDDVRRRALQVIRHYLASKHVFVDRNQSGSWPVQTESGMASSIRVGACVTAMAQQRKNVYEIVHACFAGSILRHPPTRRRIDRYLAMEEAPVDEKPIPDELPHLEGPTTIEGVLRLMGLCRALENEANLESPQRLTEAAAPTGPVARALLRFGQRLEGARASCDLLSGALCVDFSDRQATFHVNPKSRELARRIRRDGPEMVGDELADSFHRLDQQRRRILRAVQRAAAARCWRFHCSNLPLLGIGPRWHFGLTRRDVTFLPGQELTEALETLALEASARRTLSGDIGFIGEVVEALASEDPQDAAEPPALTETRLAPATTPPAPTLRELDPATVNEMDVFARGAVARFLRSDDVIWQYTDRNYFDPDADTWATLADWVHVAVRQHGDAWMNPIAILILLDAEDPRGAERAREYLARAEPHHEVGAAEVELVWRFRHGLPDVARRWFAPQPYDEVPFAQVRARLGDPVARRHVIAELNRPPNPDDPQTWPTEVDLLAEMIATSRDARGRVHRRLLEWAKTSWMWSPPSAFELRVAHALGFADVAEALEYNEFLLPGLLCADKRSELMDEPGLLSGHEFILAWSRLNPTPLLARLIATAHTRDLAAEAERAARAAVQNNPRAEANLDMSLNIYRQWLKELEPALAIAWIRCRARAVGRQ